MSEYKVIDSEKLIVGEGPIWDEKCGILYYIDFLGHKIKSFDYEGCLIKTLDLDFDPGCVALTEDGYIVASSEHEIRLLNEYGSSYVINRPFDFKGARFNDGKVGPDGRLYIGSKGHSGGAAFYRMDHDGCMELLFDGVTLSNGLDWSPDGRTMYYCDTASKLMEAFDFDPDTGAVNNRRTIFELPYQPGQFDGLTVDDDGNIWVAVWLGSRILNINPACRKLIREYVFPVSRVSSCGFFGPRLDELAVTSACYQAEAGDEPLAGCTFALQPGVRGRKANRLKLTL